MPLSVLVVGGENLCRSPLGAALLGQALAAAGVPATVQSAGVRVIAGHPVDTFTHLVAQEHGVDLRPHCARQITEDMQHAADLVMVMDHGLALELHDFAPQVSDRVRLFDHWLGARGIPDPRHRSIEFHRAVHLVMADAAKAWANWLSYPDRDHQK